MTSKLTAVIAVMCLVATSIFGQGFSDARIRDTAGGGFATVTNNALYVTSVDASGASSTFDAAGNLPVVIGDASGETVDVEDDSLVTIDRYHKRVHDSQAFYVKGFVDVANGGTSNFVFITGDNSSNAHFFVDFAAEGEVTITAYSNSTYASAGTALTVENRDLRNGNTATLSLYGDAQALTNGVQIWQAKLGSSRFFGGNVADEGGWILASNTVYSLTVENNVSGSATWFDYLIDWYEE